MSQTLQTAATQNDLKRLIPQEKRNRHKELVAGALI